MKCLRISLVELRNTMAPAPHCSSGLFTWTMDHGTLTIMITTVSKSEFKPKAFEYLRIVEEQRREIIITDHGTPVARIVPIPRDEDPAVMELRDTVLRYEAALEPVPDTDWDATR